ncbi:hypothetical protein scyTo_0006026 [Scyliorhinus torazame]|uniref:Uncharacterized protein n=1 Tax=Scyliorhinus torazame TaxID=75743 RepID=A0A401PEY2_SCYTO|nr:hypothetical protein [Scyliorhinus torazame]
MEEEVVEEEEKEEEKEKLEEEEEEEEEAPGHSANSKAYEDEESTNSRAAGRHGHVELTLYRRESLPDRFLLKVDFHDIHLYNIESLMTYFYIKIIVN